MNYLTVKDVGELLHIGRDNAYKLFKKKNFPSIMIGRKYIVEENSLKEYLKKSEYSSIVL